LVGWPKITVFLQARLTKSSKVAEKTVFLQLAPHSIREIWETRQIRQIRQIRQTSE
jgi:hypothetical protein